MLLAIVGERGMGVGFAAPSTTVVGPGPAGSPRLEEIPSGFPLLPSWEGPAAVVGARARESVGK